MAHQLAWIWIRLVLVCAHFAVLILFVPGWFGAERVFFQRHFEHKPVRLSELVRLVRPFYGRFMALGVPLALVVLTFVFGLGSLIGRENFHRPQTVYDIPLAFTLPLATFAFIVDFLLTFIPPALAYTTRSVTNAVQIGLGMIRDTWPRSALYLLCPPLALNLLHNVFPAHGVFTRMGITCVTVLVGLVAKGAIAAFYLRERGSYSEHGAAYIEPEADTAALATDSWARSTPAQLRRIVVALAFATVIPARLVLAEQWLLGIEQRPQAFGGGSGRSRIGQPRPLPHAGSACRRTSQAGPEPNDREHGVSRPPRRYGRGGR
jgi:hypothetical protein